MSKLLIWLINIYQIFFSFDKGLLRIFVIGGACKFTPTCSEYTKQAIIKEGPVKGLFKGFKRVLSCR